jgi:cytochrome c
MLTCTRVLPRTVTAAAMLAVLYGCSSPEGQGETIVAGGDPERGRAALVGFGCGSCHVIPGVRGARGMVGPPLSDFALRAYIAGQLPNQPENLMRWVQNPQAVEPGTAMPNLGVGPAVARDMAAYLYTLR